MITKKHIIIGSLVLFSAGVVYFFYHEAKPKIDYSIVTVPIIEDNENAPKEKPLETIISKDSVAFSVTFEYGVGEVNTESIQFWTTYDNYIIVKLNYSPDKEDSSEIEEREMYELQGIITGLKDGEWRMRVEEPNGRLLDEARFEVVTGEDVI